MTGQTGQQRKGKKRREYNDRNSNSVYVGYFGPGSDSDQEQPGAQDQCDEKP